MPKTSTNREVANASTKSNRFFHQYPWSLAKMVIYSAIWRGSPQSQLMEPQQTSARARFDKRPIFSPRTAKLR
jgi:hypothetical protein